MARHSDGFTRRLFGYDIRVGGRIADVTADWFLPSPATEGFRIQFPIDGGPVERCIPALRQMNENYVADPEDLGTQIIVVELDEERIRRHVYGGWFLVDRHPELQGFLELFAWIEDQVVTHLPWPADDSESD